MSFMFPLGLLGLIGVPVIIIIYIIQSKYTEQTVNSNYLWHLSDKFMKRKNPLSGITGIISLILQLLMVIAISLIISRPIITLPNAAKDYCFVVDASSSMTMVEGEETRFDMAKEEIERIIKKSKNGSSFSLVTVSDDTVREFDGVTNKKTAIELLEKVQPSQANVNHNDLLSTAQSIFDSNTSTLIYLVTDKDYNNHENIEVIDVGNETVDNYGIFDTAYSLSGGRLKVNASAISYVNNADLTIKLTVDGKAADEKKFSVKAGEITEISFDVPCTAFSEFKLEVLNTDGYMLDNTLNTYNQKSDKSYSVLIVSETGFFFKAVIDALVDSTIDIVSPLEYETITDKYGLYIFDSYTPSVLPNGAVWLINSDKSVEDSGFGVRGKIELTPSGVIEKSKSTATNVRKLLEGVGDSEIYITNYVKYSGMYLGFHTLYSYDSNPLIFAGANGLGNRQVVFAFDLHKSDFALSTDFVILLSNLLDYSFPNVIDETSYTVGDEAIVNILKNSENLKAESPSGKDIYLETDGATATMRLDEVGTYTVSLTLGGEEMKYKLFSSAHSKESEPTLTEEEFSLSGEKTEANIDGKYDPMMVLFICLAILFIADWGVYCYEKYQLR